MTWLGNLLAGTPKPPMASPLDKLDTAMEAVSPRLTGAERVTWLAALIPPMRSSGIVTPRRMAAFLSQVAVESGGFTALAENLNYSAERLCEVWPSRFTPASALPCERNPQALANAVYCNRLGNGDARSGDGWTYRGRGLIQLTGKANYQRFAASVSKPVGDVLAWLTTPAGAAASACWFWTLPDHRPALNALADVGDIAGITRAVNGGLTGLRERQEGYEAALKALL